MERKFKPYIRKIQEMEIARNFEKLLFSSILLLQGKTQAQFKWKPVGLKGISVFSSYSSSNIEKS